MVFGLLKGAADLVGAVVGTVLGVSAAVAAETLGVSETLVKSALDSGCKTMDEVRDFIRNG